MAISLFFLLGRISSINRAISNYSTDCFEVEINWFVLFLIYIKPINKQNGVKPTIILTNKYFYDEKKRTSRFNSKKKCNRKN